MAREVRDMPKANLTLQNGTVVVIEGTAEEIQELLTFYGGDRVDSKAPPIKQRRALAKRRPKRPGAAESGTASAAEVAAPDISEVVNLIKTCDEAELIETRILDQSSVINRTLLPLYIVHEHLGNSIGLTSGDVNKITTELGIPVRTPNASTTLSSSAARYVVGDKVRKNGVPVRYKMSRRGVQYLKSVIAGTDQSARGAASPST
jgi:hypothetical protein